MVELATQFRIANEGRRIANEGRQRTIDPPDGGRTTTGNASES